MIPELTFYKIHDNAPTIRHADFKREWMDNTHQRYAYRCVPLSMANASGWEILCPTTFEVMWDGGNSKESLKIVELGEKNIIHQVASSHFGHGILTFHVGYLLKTSTGWATWVGGTPNQNKKKIVPLDGLVETDWLPFTFTMNWLFNEKGTVRFEEGEPFCFVHLVHHLATDRIQPVIKSLKSNPVLEEQYINWSNKRTEFNKGLEERNPEFVKAGWQKFYIKGQGPNGETADFHLTKRRLKEPREE